MGCSCNKPKHTPKERDYFAPPREYAAPDLGPRYIKKPKKVECPTSIKNYFLNYSTLEKQLVVENLGLDTGIASITNNPDEEDLTHKTLNNVEVISFKDKKYDTDVWSGYGRKFLRKNMTTPEACEDAKNILTQDMFLDENGDYLDHTIFIVLYDYDLDGKWITLPDYSIILFMGGSFQNGKLRGNNIMFLPQAIDIETFLPTVNLDDVTFVNGLMLYKCETITAFINDVWYVITQEAAVDSLMTEVTELKARVTELENKINS